MLQNKYLVKAYSHRVEIIFLILAVVLTILSIISRVALFATILGPILLVLTVLIWKKPLLATTALLVLLPFHSLAMRVIQVEIGFSDRIILLLSMWKEFVLLVLVLRAISTNKLSTKFNWVDVLIVLYILFNTMYVFISDNLSVGLYGFRGTVEPFAFYLIGKKLPFTSPRLTRVLKYLLIIAVILSIFGAIQAYVLGTPFLWKYRAENNILSNSHHARIGGILVVRASSTFTSPNHLGMYLSILMLVVLGLFTRKRSSTEMIILAILLMGLLFTLSRSSWLALAVGIVTMLVIRGRISKRYVIATIVLTILSLPIIIQLNIVNRIAETLTLTDPSAAGKLPSIMNGIYFVLQNPLGIGLGMAGPRSIRFGDILQYHAENYYVLMAMEIGLVGLFIYVSLLWAVVTKLYKNSIRLEEPWYKGVAFGTLLAVVGVSAGVMFIPSLQELTVASLLWFFIGISTSSSWQSLTKYKPISLSETNQTNPV